jgi:myo-inositol-hexaphosphate 3-phosphohydrolase
MNIKSVLAAIVIVFSLLAIGNVAFAAAAKKQNHHDGHRLVAAKLKTDGHHNIDKKGHYTASVDSKGGKIAAFHVVHDTKGNIPVKKYKTNKKMAQATDPQLTYVSLVLVQDTDMGTVYIGYSYVDDDGNEEIYWFPAEEILDGDTGAVEYVPLNS